MVQLNRREFLRKSVAVSAATAFAPHLSAMSLEDVRQPGNPVPQESCTGPSVQPQFGRGCKVINWREQGLNLSGRSARNRRTLR